ncbi:MAG: 1-acyl-sn-glycerol-3-phosphate acyltransferase [Oscillospiraceae bacterium]|nr:1-acyl-sn-glycerol-3-phosphate acyltransferase [Oscillospiraceae bacterium]
MLYTVLRAIARPIVYLLFNIRFVGLENIRDNGGFVLCSNHRSFLDPVFIAVGIKKRKLNFMAKQELFKNKLIGAFFRGIGAFPVNRGKGDVEAINKAENIVENNGIVLIFPEGTRSKDGNVMRFKSGAAYIASVCDADIVPAGISYEGKGLSFRKKVTVTFGPAIPNAEITIRDDHRVEDARRVNNLLRDSVLELIEKGRN